MLMLSQASWVLLHAAATSPCGSIMRLMSQGAGDFQSPLGENQCPLQQGCDEFVTCYIHIAAEEAETHRGAAEVHSKLIHPQREKGIQEERNQNE